MLLKLWGGSVWRRLVLSGLNDRSFGEKSRSVLFDCWTKGVVGALRI